MLWLVSAMLGISTVSAQFAPATGPVSNMVNFTSANSGQNGFFVTIDNAAKTLAIMRPGNPTVSYAAPGGGGGTRILSYAFVGQAGLLAKTTETDGVNSNITLNLLRLQIANVANVQAPGLISRQFFMSDQPQLFVDGSSDGQVIFTRIILADIPGNDAQEITLWRTDTGASLCSLGSVDRQLSDSFTAAVTGTNVSITWHRPSFGDQTQTCLLPSGNLAISPQPLSFSQILSTATLDRTLTLSNTGDDVLVVNAIASSAHFSVMTGLPATLQPSGSAGSSGTVTIRFAPNGAPATGTQTFNEMMAITRTPAKGASTVQCQGSSRAPVPRLVVTPLSLNFGCELPGSMHTATFALTSTGDIPVTVTGITGPVAPYALTAPPPAVFAIGMPIPPGAPAKTFTVAFAPAAAGTFNGTVTITSTDPANPTRTVTITGVGHVPAPKFGQDASVTTLSYGGIETGYRYGKGVKFQNTGDLDLQFTVEVLGDPRFTVSTTPDIPGPGVRGPFVVTIPANAMCSPGAVTEQILRVTFDAALPVGGPYTGTLRITAINDPTAPATPIDIALDGSVIAAKSLDAALVLDRSGSMADNMAPGAGTKAEAVRSASRLFFELMRTDVGDRAALLQFNTTVDPLVHRLDVTTANLPTFINAVQNGANLTPMGGTSIAGGLYQSFQELNDPSRDVRATLVVTDGNDNTDYTIPGTSNTVSLDTLQTQIPAGIAVHALCLGTAANTDLGRLTALANASGGLAKASDNVSSLGIFDVEKFFLQAATTILGGTTSVDPVDKIYPGQTRTWQVELIPADKAVSFVLLFKNGALPFTVIAPDGTVFPLGAPPAGFGQAYSTPPNARILRIQLPTADPAKYAGVWKLIVRHDGYLEIRGKGDTKQETKNPVDYAFAVSVFSNLRMVPLVSPQPLHPGDPITVSAFLTEEETKVLGSDINVKIKYPDAVTTRMLHLYDDGLHNDGAANDGEYGNVFTQTSQAGFYSFGYHAAGTSARGGNYVREADISQYVTPVTPPGGDHPGGAGTPVKDSCCTLIVRCLVVLAIIGLVIILLLLRRARAAS